MLKLTDLGKQAGDIKWWVDIRTDFRPLRSLAFDCEEFSLTRLYDPRFLQTLSEIVPLDARRNPRQLTRQRTRHDQPERSAR